MSPPEIPCNLRENSCGRPVGGAESGGGRREESREPGGNRDEDWTRGDETQVERKKTVASIVTCQVGDLRIAVTVWGSLQGWAEEEMREK